MVMSVGWNPFYKNSKKTIEVHLLHEFERDFYQEELRVIAVGFIRNELDFPDIRSLVEAIRDDILFATEQLDREPFSSYERDSFFTEWKQTLGTSSSWIVLLFSCSTEIPKEEIIIVIIISSIFSANQWFTSKSKGRFRCFWSFSKGAVEKLQKKSISEKKRQKMWQERMEEEKEERESFFIELELTDW